MQTLPNPKVYENHIFYILRRKISKTSSSNDYRSYTHNLSSCEIKPQMVKSTGALRTHKVTNPVQALISQLLKLSITAMINHVFSQESLFTIFASLAYKKFRLCLSYKHISSEY